MTTPTPQKQAFTPGPWLRNIRCDGKYSTVFAGRNTHVAHVCQQKDGAETEANIDLIASAPDLLEACEVALEFIEARERKYNMTASTEGNLLRFAIAKARGQA